LLSIKLKVDHAPPVGSCDDRERADKFAVPVGVSDCSAMNQHEPRVLKRLLLYRRSEDGVQHLMTFNALIKPRREAASA